MIHLTPREIEVIRLIADGHTDNGISEKLNIAPGTAHFHALNALRKLGKPNRASAAVEALRQGIIL